MICKGGLKQKGRPFFCYNVTFFGFFYKIFKNSYICLYLNIIILTFEGEIINIV